MARVAWNKGLKTGKESFLTRRKKSLARLGEKNPSWNGGKKMINGYRYIYSPNHPYAPKGKNKYVAEHRLIVEKKIGRYLLPQEKVHHLNGDKLDNRMDNLLVISSSEHARLHYRDGTLAYLKNYTLDYQGFNGCECGETVHFAKGLCKRCYQAEWRKIHNA